MENQAVLFEKISKYARWIEAGEKIEQALNRLERVSMTLELLSTTEIGKIVNRLRLNEKFGDKASKIVENWRNMAKNTQKEIEIVEKSITKNSCNNINVKVSNSNVLESNNSKRKATDKVDAFSAALAAGDNVKESKPKRLRSDDHILASIEKSLAESVRLLPRNVSSIKPITNTVTIEEDATIFKASKSLHKVYSGRKKTGYVNGDVPKLFDICLKKCLNNIDAIEETGDIPFNILQPILEKCTHLQLAKIESKNRYLEDDSDYLWERHCFEMFPKFKPKLEETWKRRFMRLMHEQDIKMKNHLQEISAKINSQHKFTNKSQLKAMLADPIAPRDARRRQIKNGTVCHSSMIPNAAELSRSRRQIFESGSSSDLKKMPLALRSVTTSTLSSSDLKQTRSEKNLNPLLCSKPKVLPKQGVLMMKSLKMMKSRPR